MQFPTYFTYIHKWCSDKTNCKSDIQIVDRTETVKNDPTKKERDQRHRKAMRNLNLEIQKIICFHCEKKETRKKW
jgi:hypothetical protein